LNKVDENSGHGINSHLVYFLEGVESINDNLRNYMAALI
jgi:hypothetical protein